MVKEFIYYYGERRGTGCTADQVAESAWRQDLWHDVTDPEVLVCKRRCGSRRGMSQDGWVTRAVLMAGKDGVGRDCSFGNVSRWGCVSYVSFVCYGVG